RACRAGPIQAGVFAAPVSIWLRSASTNAGHAATPARLLKVLSIGSVPPEWGGPVRGGVATFHAALLEGLARGLAEIAVAPLRLIDDRSPPFETFPLEPGENRRSQL